MRQELEKARTRWEAGRVDRWHAHPTIHGQTVADHTYGVVQWLRFIVPKQDLTKRLLLAALNHDVAEIFTGDIPFTAKRLYPELAEVLDRVEQDIHLHLDSAYALTENEVRVLKFADLTEMGFYALREFSLGNSTMQTILTNVLNALTVLPNDNMDVRMLQNMDEISTYFKNQMEKLQ